MAKRSIYKEFSAKLIIATTLFTLIMSYIFYGFTKATIYEGITNELINKAKIFYDINANKHNINENQKLIFANDLTIDLLINYNLKEMSIKQYNTKDNNHYIELLYPFDLKKGTFLKLTQNINKEDAMLKKIFSNIFILGIGGLVMIILYALAVSKTLLLPIVNISNTLSNMNEYELSKIDENKLPIEFLQLAKSINNLTNKVQTYVKYQKELFIGAAHELKTPLAVIKLKSEVTLIKKRESEKYEETLKITIDEINKMSAMITSILSMGRQEGAQFERPKELDLIEFLKIKIENYNLLTSEKNITIKYNTDIHDYVISIQATLLNQILQNFVQNAIKFTKKDSIITINSYKKHNVLIIEVIDEGIGIDESIDLFAPFKRIGNQGGAGLGLYLVKMAADTIGAHVQLKNRTDGQTGCIATLTLTNPICHIPSSKT